MKEGIITNKGIIWTHSSFKAVILRHESEIPLRETNHSVFLPPVSSSQV